MVGKVSQRPFFNIAVIHELTFRALGYAHAALCVKRFGHSLPGKAAYKFFGFEVSTMTTKVGDYLEKIKDDAILRQEFVEL